MYRYIIKRLLMLIPVLLCVAFIIFAIMDVADGDPVYSVVSADATEEEIEATREAMGLNGSLIERYFRYVRVWSLEISERHMFPSVMLWKPTLPVCPTLLNWQPLR